MQPLFRFALLALGVSCASCTGAEIASDSTGTDSSPAERAELTGASSDELSTLAPGTKTLAYVEVNSNDFNNVGCYTYDSPAKPYFTFASIFAANINYDSARQKPILYFNPQVDTVLNRTSYVKNLQSLGIKVLLTVLGNHQNAGWACFRDEATAQDFASQLAAAANKYGLDGIDIDDEYSTCSTNDTSLIVVASKMRAAMPNKIISKALFSDTSYFRARWNGHKLADYLDYGWEMTYGYTNYAARLSPYLAQGMTKEKLSIGVSTGGSDGAGAAKYVNDNGIGTLMTYNVTKSSQSYLSGQSRVLYGGKTVQVKPNCLK
ncbi:glycosyl hydrolase family 18 protein [Pendulispora albinea]|uniref:Glycosyl hydrolase family 18 protein n=1 Tax=Pendulispora albinea TaxID=2741071 RepID=A0ABZ2LW55_9BACT